MCIYLYISLYIDKKKFMDIFVDNFFILFCTVYVYEYIVLTNLNWRHSMYIYLFYMKTYTNNICYI